MTAYTTASGVLRLWTPRRNPSKPTYGGLLDNTVAGGISSGMSILDTLVKESEEEASFPESLVRGGAKAVGTVSYFYLRHKSAGGEEGLLQPEVEYCYDLEVGEDVVPAPGDDEVQEFKLWDVEKVQEELAKGNFKPNCSLGRFPYPISSSGANDGSFVGLFYSPWCAYARERAGLYRDCVPSA